MASLAPHWHHFNTHVLYKQASTAFIEVYYDSSFCLHILYTPASEDYTRTQTLLTFGPSRSNTQVTVPIMDDEIVEANETFFGNLRVPVGSDLDTISILYQPGKAIASIQDNDSKQF